MNEKRQTQHRTTKTNNKQTQQNRKPNNTRK